jgi:hypothetical protein
MKPSAFPVTIMVENNKEEVIFQHLCLNLGMLQRGFIKVKSLYHLKPHCTIYFLCNSKVNEKIANVMIESDFDEL